jgi:hypothetical protein
MGRRLRRLPFLRDTTVEFRIRTHQQVVHTTQGSTKVSDTRRHRQHFAHAMTIRTLTSESPIKFAAQRTAVRLAHTDSRSVWMPVTACQMAPSPSNALLCEKPEQSCGCGTLLCDSHFTLPNVHEVPATIFGWWSTLLLAARRRLFTHSVLLSN